MIGPNMGPTKVACTANDCQCRSAKKCNDERTYQDNLKIPSHTHRDLENHRNGISEIKWLEAAVKLGRDSKLRAQEQISTK